MDIIETEYQTIRGIYFSKISPIRYLNHVVARAKEPPEIKEDLRCYYCKIDLKDIVYNTIHCTSNWGKKTTLGVSSKGTGFVKINTTEQFKKAFGK